MEWKILACWSHRAEAEIKLNLEGKSSSQIFHWGKKKKKRVCLSEGFGLVSFPTLSVPVSPAPGSRDRRAQCEAPFHYHQPSRIATLLILISKVNCASFYTFYEWDHATCTLSRPSLLLSTVFITFNHKVVSRFNHLFSLLCDIPLCEYTRVFF